jgi:hypothetical protein
MTKHRYAEGKLSTSIALPNKIRDALIQAGDSEWGQISRIATRAIEKELKAMGYLQEEKPKSIVIQSPPKPKSDTQICNFVTL